MHEMIEGEAILIDLSTGSYYSMRDAGAVVWAALDRGSSEEEIAETLGVDYDAPREKIREAVRKLLAELENEGLIVSRNGADPLTVPPTTPAAAGHEGRRPFTIPVLEKHTDMQDLILLDPVHDVDARGWPHAAEPGPDAA
jgi:hypothetical protein